jgi:putative tryptophan/tyrosine transport system permease protein
MFDALESSIVQGVMYGIGTMGLAFTFRFLKFPDFTALASIMLGGVICISIANFTNPYIGLIAAFICCGTLGLITSLQHVYLKINPILASIITFTASITIGYLLSDAGGQISLLTEKIYLFSPIYRIGDLLKILALSFIVSISVYLLMASKFGSKILAMNASRSFLEFRHRDRKKVFITVCFIGNSIVGLAGGLLSLRSVTAQVEGNTAFLSHALAGIFGASALFSLITINFKKLSSKSKVLAKIMDFDTDAHFINKDNPLSIAFWFFGYFAFCSIIYVVYISVSDGANIPFTKILMPKNFHYLVQAIVIFLMVALYGKFDDD